MKRFDDTKNRASNFGISRRGADHKEKENINFSLGHVLVISSLVGKITLHEVISYFFLNNLERLRYIWKKSSSLL